jgi:acetyl esterase/lipase
MKFAAMLAAAVLAGAPLPASAQSMTAGKVNALPASEPYLRASYGFTPLQVGELRVPPGKGPFPVVVVIHGGCWLKGEATMRIMAPLATALTARGFATWNIEYRQLGDPGGGWPGTFEDWALAIDHLRILAKTEPLDLTRVITLGHSAGSLGAAWLAARPQLSGKLHGDDPVPVKTVVNIDGPDDLVRYLPVQRDICDAPVIEQLLGGTPDTQPARYKDANPAQRLPLHAAELLVSSAVLSPPAAEAYAEKVRASGDRAEVLTLPGVGHFDPIAPGTASWTKVEDFIVQNALK